MEKLANFYFIYERKNGYDNYSIIGMKQLLEDLMNLKRVIIEKLKERVNFREAYSKEFPNYFRTFKDSVVDGIDQLCFWTDFANGNGNELFEKNGIPPKFLALSSSSAFVVNNFAIFKQKGLKIPFFHDSRIDHFEYKCPNGFGTPPNLDLMLRSETKVIGIESKFLEILNKKKPDFSGKYKEFFKSIPDSNSWKNVFEMVCKEKVAFEYLDVAQLIKHFCGLYNTFFTTKKAKAIELHYIFFEPKNPDRFKQFKSHKDELKRFSSLLNGEDIVFSYRSYQDFWDLIDDSNFGEEDKSVKNNFRQVRQRYDFEV